MKGEKELQIGMEVVLAAILEEDRLQGENHLPLRENRRIGMLRPEGHRLHHPLDLLREQQRMVWQNHLQEVELTHHLEMDLHPSRWQRQTMSTRIEDTLLVTFAVTDVVRRATSHLIVPRKMNP